ncbi:uncharacterized protein N7500_002770 [Penicillium coprophilum]|uniref:uncharacterized protein n=1 Tax=Penicillium coprophilum TaxID=36646 RepID=UPI002392196D|nr:uncharacterized protein N7500_002770 [Penicillium coprophilum]KAJ5169987.1 hypothetical protein N7500_002770 [Penicillium coprophilum]
MCCEPYYFLENISFPFSVFHSFTEGNACQRRRDNVLRAYRSVLYMRHRLLSMDLLGSIYFMLKR